MAGGQGEGRHPLARGQRVRAAEPLVPPALQRGRRRSPATSPSTRPRGISGRSERVEDLARDQIEYPEEDPFIRHTFEAELAKRGLTSLMPDQAYKDPNYKWDYDEGD